MHHKLLLGLLIFPISATHAMKLVLENNEIITYNIAPRLDRDDRTAFKLINKKLYTMIIPQHILNERYNSACNKNDAVLMDDLRRQGALKLAEEAYKLFLNKKPELSKTLPRNQVDVSDLFLYGIEQNNINFMHWLLSTRKPYFGSLLLDRSLAHSKKLNYDEITQLLNDYVKIQAMQSMQSMQYWDDEMGKYDEVVAIPEPLYRLDDTGHRPNVNEYEKCILS